MSLYAKGLFLCASLAVAPLAFASPGPYSYKTVPHDELIEHMVPGSDATGTPAPLQGLWWMDGNPLPDEIVSFAGTQFTAIEKNGTVVGYEAATPVYDQGAWSWHDSREGKGLHQLALKLRAVYRMVFNADFTQGEITPVISVLPGPQKTEIPQSLVLKFSLRQVSPVEYSRDSIIAGRSSQYRFRQIVDGEGQILPAYADYLASVKARDLPAALLPICADADQDNLVLPTVCAFR